MNQILKVGFAAAAGVMVAVIGLSACEGWFGPGGGSAPTSSPAPSAPLATAEPTAPEPSRFILREQPEIGAISVSLPASGWTGLRGDRLLLPTTGNGTGIEEYDGDLWIYGDPCSWSTTTPDAPATTANEIIAALGSQASRDASAPADITIGKYAGQSITLHVPADIPFSGDSTFPDCDEGFFGTLTWRVGGVRSSQPERYAQGPTQIDEIWVVEVNRVPVLFDLAYWPDTPPDVIDEMRAIVASATFGE